MARYFPSHTSRLLLQILCFLMSDFSLPLLSPPSAIPLCLSSPISDLHPSVLAFFPSLGHLFSPHSIFSSGRSPSFSSSLSHSPPFPPSVLPLTTLSSSAVGLLLSLPPFPISHLSPRAAIPLRLSSSAVGLLLPLPAFPTWHHSLAAFGPSASESSSPIDVHRRAERAHPRFVAENTSKI